MIIFRTETILCYYVHVVIEYGRNPDGSRGARRQSWPIGGRMSVGAFRRLFGVGQTEVDSRIGNMERAGEEPFPTRPTRSGRRIVEINVPHGVRQLLNAFAQTNGPRQTPRPDLRGRDGPSGTLIVTPDRTDNVVVIAPDDRP